MKITLAIILIFAAINGAPPQPSDTPNDINISRSPIRNITSNRIAGVALVVSGVSLAMSIRTWYFNRKVKGLELRALLLSTLNGALIKAENLLTDYDQAKDVVLRGKDIDTLNQLYERKFGDSIENIIETVKSDLRRVEDTNVKAAIQLYEEMNPRTISNALRIDDLATEMASFKTNLIAKLASEQSDKPAKAPEN